MDDQINLNLAHLRSIGGRVVEPRDAPFRSTMIFILATVLGIATIVALNHFGLNYSAAM